MEPPENRVLFSADLPGLLQGVIHITSQIDTVVTAGPNVSNDARATVEPAQPLAGDDGCDQGGN